MTGGGKNVSGEIFKFFDYGAVWHNSTRKMPAFASLLPLTVTRGERVRVRAGRGAFFGFREETTTTTTTMEHGFYGLNGSTRMTFR